MRGTAYTRTSFYHHWKKLFEPAQDQFKKQERVEFSPHDLRHLRVTRTATKIRQETQGDPAKEAALLEGFQHLMGWSSPATMATYMILVAALFALGAHVSRNTQTVLKAVELLEKQIEELRR